MNPANRRKLTVLCVGTGLAGASASAALGELGYNVITFCIHDSPRRAHSIAAQGGINAAKNYRNDGDSIYRLFYDTVKGGDYRAREANVYRLAQVSVDIIDQCVAQGVPFAREYGGLLDNRSFGGAQVSRTFYARGQTGQQLLHRRLSVDDAAGGRRAPSRCSPQREMLDLVLVDGQARGIIARNLVTGELETWVGRRRAALHRRLRHCVLPLHQRGQLATSRRRGAPTSAAPCLPIPASPRSTRPASPSPATTSRKLTLMSESLRNDGRVWVPKKPGDKRPPTQIPDAERDYYLERRYPSFGNLVPRDVASRAAKLVCDDGRGVGETGLAVYLDFADAIHRLGKDVISERYGNLFDMYQKITDDNPYEVPMRIYPRRALHDGRPVGGLQPDEHHPGPACARRGELLGPRRQSPRRERAHAGPGRRLLRDPVHAEPLPRQHRPAEGHHDTRRLQRSRRQRAGSDHAPVVGQGQQDASRAAPPARSDLCGTTSACRAPTTA